MSIENLNQEPKKRGRPKKEESEKMSLSFSEENNDLLVLIEDYLAKAQWTKRDLMLSIGFGETQLYRWSRGESVPRRSTINRIAVALAKRLDSLYGDRLTDPSPATDYIDFILNELHRVSGFSSNIKGADANICWERINSLREIRVGYLQMEGLIETPKLINEHPSGKLVNYVNMICAIINVRPKWCYLDNNILNSSVRNRNVDIVAPTVLKLPARKYDLEYSNPCSNQNHIVKALICEKDQNLKYSNKLENYPESNLELVFAKGGLAEIGTTLLGYKFTSKSFDTEIEAINYINRPHYQNQPIPIFLTDSLTHQSWINKTKFKHELKDFDLYPMIEMDTGLKIKAKTAFAFHPDEIKLREVINETIEVYNQDYNDEF